MTRSSRLAFSAVVGQAAAKRALVLAATQPRLAGVLLRGDKGSGKTTLARGLAALLPGDAPFVELPLGATEERVIGSLDLATLLASGEPRFRPGLLAAAHGGVLYVDEINLLADHLVDALLDVAVSGVNRVERDGLSHTHPARFVLVASMNPEEGELRPQLLDRFGLAVEVGAPVAVVDRSLVVRRQLAAEAGSDGAAPTDEAARLGAGSVDVGDSFAVDDERIRAAIDAARSAAVTIGDDVIDVACSLALAVGAEGMRADLMLCRAAVATAALDGRSSATVDDVRSIAEMVLGHRRRRRPFDEPGISPQELEQAWDEALLPQPPPSDDRDADPDPDADADADVDSSGPGDAPDQTDAPTAADRFVLPDTTTSGRRSQPAARRDGGFEKADAARGRFVRTQPYGAGSGSDIDGHATAIAVATRRAAAGLSAVGPDVTSDDLRSAQRESRRGNLVVFVVDASASMGVEHRMAATKAAIIGLLGDAYRRRGRVALITFRGESAEVVLRPTASVEIAKARLVELATGGTTPLAAGLDAARNIATGAAGDQGLDCHIVLITDGRATSGGGDPVGASRIAALHLATAVQKVVVIDTETGSTRLGLANDLAESIGASYFHLDSLGADGIERTARALAT